MSTGQQKKQVNADNIPLSQPYCAECGCPKINQRVLTKVEGIYNVVGLCRKHRIINDSDKYVKL